METPECPDAPHDYAAMAHAICRAVTARIGDEAALDECGRIAEHLGFTGFSYLVVRPGTVGSELVHHWTTASVRWKSLYRTRALHLADPRIAHTRGRSIPVAWAADTASADPRTKVFNRAASAHFIRGGVAMSLQEEHGYRTIVCWDARVIRYDATRDPNARAELATLSLLAGFVHEKMTGRAKGNAARSVAPPLTQRERECLTLAAHGMTSADIGVKLGIAERTANFHIANIIDKLGALNRGEAIARGVALNLVARP